MIRSMKVVLKCYKCGLDDMTMVVTNPNHSNEKVYCWLCFKKTIKHLLNEDALLSMEKEG